MKEDVKGHIRPDYYTKLGVYEPVKVIDAWGLNYNLGTVAAYLARAGHKEGEAAVKDLKKIRFFLDREIAKHEEVNKANAGDAAGASKVS